MANIETMDQWSHKTITTSRFRTKSIRKNGRVPCTEYRKPT